MLLLLLLKITKYKTCKHKLSKETRIIVRNSPSQVLRFSLATKRKVSMSYIVEDVGHQQPNQGPKIMTSGIRDKHEDKVDRSLGEIHCSESGEWKGWGHHEFVCLAHVYKGNGHVMMEGYNKLWIDGALCHNLRRSLRVFP